MRSIASCSSGSAYWPGLPMLVSRSFMPIWMTSIPGRRGDRLDILHAFPRLDHAGEQGIGIDRRQRLGRRHRGEVEIGIAAGDAAAAERAEAHRIDGGPRILGGVHVRIDDAGDAVVEQRLHVEVAHERTRAKGATPSATRGLGDMADGLQVEQAVLDIDEQEVVPGGAGDAGDLGRAGHPHAEAEHGPAGGQLRPSPGWSARVRAMAVFLRCVLAGMAAPRRAPRQPGLTLAVPAPANGRHVQGESIRMADIRVKAEIAGSVWKILVQPGEAVAAEDSLMLLELMKMEIPVVAPQRRHRAGMAVGGRRGGGRGRCRRGVRGRDRAGGAMILLARRDARCG